MPELTTIYDYMRAYAGMLGKRILQEYPALHQFDDPISPRIEQLLRKPFPAQPSRSWELRNDGNRRGPPW